MHECIVTDAPGMGLWPVLLALMVLVIGLAAVATIWRRFSAAPLALVALFVLPMAGAQASQLVDSAGDLDLANDGSSEDTERFGKWETGVEIPSTTDQEVLHHLGTSTDLTGDATLLAAVRLTSQSPSSQSTVLTWRNPGAGTQQFRFEFLSTGGQWGYRYIHTNTDGSTTAQSSSTDPINPGLHVLWVERDASAKTVTVRINGTQRATLSYTLEPRADADPDVYLGNTGRLTDASESFDGKLFEVRLWDSIPSATVRASFEDPANLDYWLQREGTELAAWSLDGPFHACTPGIHRDTNYAIQVWQIGLVLVIGVLTVAALSRGRR